MASLRPIRWLTLLGIGLLFAGLVNGQDSATATVQTSSTSAAAPLPASSSVPRVTYRNGQLTITARNASLGDLLRAVSTQTGAVIEFPADRAGEPLSAQAGPGPVRDVLATVLNGSRFNYVMLGSPSNPNLLQRMILTNAEQPAGSASSQAPSQPLVLPQQTARAEDSENSDDGIPVVAPAPLLQVSNPEHLEPPKEPLSPEVLKQMVHDRMAARQQQQAPEPNPPQ